MDLEKEVVQDKKFGWGSMCDNDLDEFVYKLKKEKALRIKCICLIRMGKSPLCDVSRMNNYDKRQLLKMVNELFENGDDDEIRKEFNENVNDILFTGGSSEYLDSVIHK